MRVDHQLLIFEALAPPPGAAAPSPAGGATAQRLAVSAFDAGGGRRAVLISHAWRGPAGWRLEPWFGLCNDPGWCDRWREAGAWVVDARIEASTGARAGGNQGASRRRGTARAGAATGQRWDVHIPYYLSGQAGVSDGVRPWMTLELPPMAGPAPAARPSHAARRGALPGSAAVTLCLWPQSPDPVQPDSQLLRLKVERPAGRVSGPRPPDASIGLADDARFPDLRGWVRPGRCAERWSQAGVALELPQAPEPGSRPAPPAPAAARRVPLASIFGPSRFRFSDVEVLGFRLSLPPLTAAEANGPAGVARRALESLVDPLNVHLSDPAAMGDFRYRLATHTVVIELLRYGRMACEQPQPPLTADDHLAQHELLVRLLVGRVDDDTAQARDAACFVPAIFVDNPWSRLLGREIEGFPKDLAVVVAGPLQDGVTPTVLCGDGRPAGAAGARGEAGDRSGPVPLTGVSAVQRAGAPGETLPPIVTFDYPAGGPPPWVPDGTLDLQAIDGTTGPARWRQDDFSRAAEFRRGFARAVARNGLGRMATIQVSPVDGRPLPPARIEGVIDVQRMTYQFPPGLAGLTLCALPATPDLSATERAWRTLVAGLAGDLQATSVQLDVVSGEWYRSRFDMTLDVSDPLDR